MRSHDSYGLGAQLDHLAEGRRPWLLLLLLSLALYLPGLASLPPVDRDEARYIQATRQMLETGDFLRIRYQDEARNKKPAGVYWLQAAAVGALSKASSTAVWPYRLVSMLGAIGAVLLTFLFGQQIFDRRTALVGAGLLAGCLDLVFEAHVATTDAVLLATAVAAQGALASAYLMPRRGDRFGPGLAALFWIAQALAILIKGPVVPAFSLLTVLALVIADRRGAWLKALRPLWGVPLMLVIVLPWLVAIEIATQGQFLNEAVGHDLLGKVAGAQEAHGAPPGYYLALLPVTFWPGTLFLGFGAVWAWRNRRLPAARFLLAWTIPSWILLEAVPTKLPHYVVPLYPALALLAAKGLIAAAEEGMAVRRWASWLPAALWALVGLALAGGLVAMPLLLGHRASFGSGIGAAAVLAAAWHFLGRERARASLANAGVAMIAGLLVMATAFALVLPDVNAIWLSRSAAYLVATERLPDERVVSTGYTEPSLVFLLGTDTKLLAPAQAAAALIDGQAKLALVADRQEPDFAAALKASGRTGRPFGAVRGFDYSNGRWMTLRLYRLAPAAP
ncbi:MAG TPA: glycosyltransferase family 39 protein [Aliidongia sp.]|uniref:ArnT family glycosyltransferase n=1 Tax=Aliidongia sp. TaxID=1914230 RepID=UPI002DDD0FCF|nr:glycosyltransferase family 39 protein [Aliidongia sp.]HEV2674473.1 glycosyltransferase family 39 protein [Aliidongia sp.]